MTLKKSMLAIGITLLLLAIPTISAKNSQQTIHDIKSKVDIPHFWFKVTAYFFMSIGWLLWAFLMGTMFQ